MWAEPDEPLEEHVEATFSFGLKELLVTWGCDQREIWVDTEARALLLNSNFLASAHVVNNQLKVEYADDWAAWADFKDSGELKDLLDKAAEKLKRKSDHSKGQGKGKPSSSQQ